MPHSQPVSSVSHLTLSQLAKRLVLSDDYVGRSLLGQPGGIPALKIGKGKRAQWRIRLCDVERWEESRIVCYDSAPKRTRGPR